MDSPVTEPVGFSVSPDLDRSVPLTLIKSWHALLRDPCVSPLLSACTPNPPLNGVPLGVLELTRVWGADGCAPAPEAAEDCERVVRPALGVSSGTDSVKTARGG